MIKHKPKTISEAIDNLQDFLESDLYSKFRPEQKLPTGKKGKLKSWYREDVFADEKEFIKYLQDHFNILKEEINGALGK